MEDQEARRLLSEERARVEQLLEATVAAGRDDREAVNEGGGMADPAHPLTTEEADDAVAATLQDRLDAVGRAEQRLAAGTFGRSLRSGAPIPDDRLRADPTAQLTVEEAGHLR